MKRLLAWVLILTLFLSACGFAPAAVSNQQTTEENRDIIPVHTEKPEDTSESRKFGLSFVPEYGFNPYSCTCITNRPVLSLVYESLFVLGSDFQPEPLLCEKFAVSDSGKKYIFRLCDGVTFSDGSQLTAYDVVNSLETARNSAYYGSRFSNVRSFTAKDELTINVRLYHPYENLPLLLDVPIVKTGTEDKQRPIGSGPYAFAGKSEKRRLVRREDWWQDRPAPVEYETISLTAAANPSEIRDSFEFGSTSLVCADLNAPTAVGYRCDYELWDCPTTTLQYIGFNLAGGLFLKRDFRAAVTHIVDREDIISSVYKGFAEAACLPCSPVSPLYDKELAESYRYDPDAFKQAKKKAGISKKDVGILLVCSADPSRVETAYRIADSMNEVGVKIEVNAVDYDTFRYRLNNGQFDMFMGEARLSANFDLTEFFKLEGALSFGAIENNAMEQLCYEALENSGNCSELQRNVMETGFFCPVLFKSYAVMANRGMIANLQPAVDNVFHLAGGKTLADATVSYEEMTGKDSEETTEDTEEENP